jgi:hypothetical protein
MNDSFSYSVIGLAMEVHRDFRPDVHPLALGFRHDYEVNSFYSNPCPS